MRINPKVTWYDETFTIGDKVRIKSTGEVGVICTIDIATSQFRLAEWANSDGSSELRTKWIGPDKVVKVVEPEPKK